MPGIALGWLLPLTVLAAPLFEEFIFRGPIFGGQRRTFGFGGAALTSAAIFVIVHPRWPACLSCAGACSRRWRTNAQVCC